MRRLVLLVALALLAGPGLAQPASRDLVTVPATSRDAVRDAGLPVLYKGASLLLAAWDEGRIREARARGIEFEVVLRGYDGTVPVFVMEVPDGGPPPPAWDASLLRRIGRRSIVAMSPERAHEWMEAGYPASPVFDRPLGWKAPRAAPIAYDCDHDPLVEALLAGTSEAQWLEWIEKLSGVEDTTVGGTEATILTRGSAAMFSGAPHARAFDFAVQQVGEWGYPPAQVELDPYTVGSATWRNLVVTIPGQTSPDEQVLLTAHLDSTSPVIATLAPGANDNGTGTATLLEAARLLRRFRFARTVRIVWFTGEEQFLLGSQAYVADHRTDDVLGVVNLDMFGWDATGDRCFEIHAGTMPESQDVGNCYRDSLAAYDLGLFHDYLTTDATDRSDHRSFWQVDVGAIEISENFFLNSAPGGCVGRDANPGYHQVTDTVADNMHPPFAFDVARAGLATIAAMAQPIEACFAEAPVLSAEPAESAVALSWTAVAGADRYRVFRSTQGCAGQWEPLGEPAATAWLDATATEPLDYRYHVEAVAPDGFCVSAASNCATAQPTVRRATATAPVSTDVCAGGGPGDGDGVVDPGESVVVALRLVNDGNVPLEDLDGALSVSTAGVGVLDAHASWPDLAPGVSALSAPNHFGLQIGTGVACGTHVPLSVAATYEGGSNPTDTSLSVGGAGCTPCSVVASPPGEPAVLAVRLDGAQLVLEWDAPDPACASGATAIYRGDLGTLRAGGYDHGPLDCALIGPSFALGLDDPRLGTADYFLAVAENGIQEGSYGLDSAGGERPPAAGACRPAQNVLPCGP